ERVRASKILKGPQNTKFSGDKQAFVKKLGQALYASKIISYTQGFMLMREAAKDNSWNLNYAGIALMWRGGCIIRSAFLGDIKNAYTNNPNLENLLFDPFFKNVIERSQDSWRQVVAEAVLLGIPTPALSTALSFYDGYRHDRLPASLLQAMRDYFGAHTFQYLDECEDETHPKNTDIHINWTGHGGNVSSSSYQA
ncbi:9146_t:CDS:2, partial [Acaulospora morrowiae]